MRGRTKADDLYFVPHSRSTTPVDELHIPNQRKLDDLSWPMDLDFFLETPLTGQLLRAATTTLIRGSY